MKRAYLTAIVVMAAPGVLTGQPGREAGKRTNPLKANIEGFRMELAYFGPNPREYYHLTLTAAPMLPKIRKDPPWVLFLHIDDKQATKLLGHLTDSGLLKGADWIAPFTRKLLKPIRGRAYVLTVSGGGWIYRKSLGWDLNMLKRLDALRKVLDGDAAKAMDKLIKVLEPQRKKWEKAADGKPPAEPAVKWGKAVGGLVCGISAFKKSVQLGIPYEIEVSIKNISKGDILLLKRRLFGNEPLHDRVYFMQAGKKYREFFTHDKKKFAVAPARKEDFVLLKPNDIYKFTHKMVVHTPSTKKNLKNIEAGLGLIGVKQEGAYLMHVRYGPWFRLANGADLGGLKPWKGVLLSAPIEVVVGKASVKPVAKPGAAGRKAP